MLLISNINIIISICIIFNMNNINIDSSNIIACFFCGGAAIPTCWCCLGLGNDARLCISGFRADWDSFTARWEEKGD